MEQKVLTYNLSMCLFVCVLYLSGLCQSNFVYIKLKIDDKEQNMDGKLKVYFTTGKNSFEPLMFRYGFVVPSDLSTLKNVGVCILYKKYKLCANSLDISLVAGDWKIRIDKRHKPKDVKSSFSIEIEPPGSEGSVITVVTKRNAKVSNPPKPQ